MKKVLFLLALLALVSLPLAALAQDEEIELAEYVSEDGFLTVSYPAEWVSEPQTDFPGVLFGSSQEALDRTNENEPTEAGDAAAGVILFPNDFLGLLGVEMTPDLTQADLTIALAESLTASEESTDPAATPDPEAEAVTTGEPIEIELEDEETITIVPVTDEELGQAGFIVAYPVGEGITLIGIGNAHGEDYDDELQQLLLDIVLSAEYTGTPEDLLASMGM
jgi:hypothetical protein